MARILLIVALLLAVFWVYSIVDCAVQDPRRHRGVSKPMWLLITIALPVLGGILWFAVGRTKRADIPRPKAPDDDPEFLGRIGDIRDTDERIRRIEEELKALDADDDDPRWNNPPQPPQPPRPSDA
ncbi:MULTISPECIES: PLD nuclease N-terminal domain-containing protein [unclassified Microbacterium]|uniref:PLD nuclease N-terminal domain-containing protein n=1 Tax=unclassified Microbacterium TaxID=2609290 RepID=UPI00214C660B|nr:MULTISPECIES: PLD nuclease N-terminal domain-containing protein [unclassified Microbacterium]MCR2799873.1 PLD nuclease N-terminal domain-containing protein [Microbacterium sp. zg.Y818]MCR2825976.1 PLD nuclease N-terminal domain-containing protein [Microbacterium sp. zg.Y909]WIM21855.1 PLD nuclease N-terminal domain-containing protein [Microbacterium sp. zg-Y818]